MDLSLNIVIRSIPMNDYDRESNRILSELEMASHAANQTRLLLAKDDLAVDERERAEHTLIRQIHEMKSAQQSAIPHRCWCFGLTEDLTFGHPRGAGLLLDPCWVARERAGDLSGAIDRIRDVGAA